MKAAISKNLEVLDIEVAQITPTQKGERTKDVASLAQSIKAVGLMVPVIVRPVPDGSDKKSVKQLYQLVDGHRRLAAAKVNKAQTIRAIEVDPLTTDDQVGVLQLTANVHRLQLTPFEEAEAIAKLRKAGRTPQEIAADLGMTPQAIARRDQLNKLTPEWINYVSKMREGYSLSVAAFEMIASYEASVQGKLLSEYLKSSHVPTVDDVKRRLSEFDRQLKSAPWKIDDGLLFPAAGACTTCQKRSSCQSLLFEGESTGKKATPDDKCLDIACWNNKLARFGRQKIDAAKEKYPDLVLIAKSGWGSDTKIVAGVSRGQKILKHSGYGYSSNDYEPAKKSDKGAVPAMRVNEHGLGALSYIKIKKSDEPAKPTKQAVTKMTPEEQAKATMQELQARRERWIRDKINESTGYQSDPPEHLLKLKPEAILQIFGKLILCEDKGNYDSLADWKTLDVAAAVRAIWSLFTENIYVSNKPRDLQMVSEHVLGLKWSDLEAEALKAIPDPKPKAGAKVAKKKGVGNK